MEGIWILSLPREVPHAMQRSLKKEKEKESCLV